MIVAALSIRARPGQAESLAAAMQEMQAASRAEAGCLVYIFSRDMTDPAVFHLCEIWENEPLMQAHINTPHALRFVTLLRAASDIEFIRAYEGETRRHRIPGPDALG